MERLLVIDVALEMTLQRDRIYWTRLGVAGPCFDLRETSLILSCGQGDFIGDVEDT